MVKDLHLSVLPVSQPPNNHIKFRFNCQIYLSINDLAKFHPIHYETN